VDKRKLFKGDHVVRVDNNFAAREGSTGVIVKVVETKAAYLVRWDGASSIDPNAYYARELGLILEARDGLF